MWSIGVIYYQMLTGKLPFPGFNRDEVIKQQNRVISEKEFPRSVSEKSITNVKSCLVQLSFKRFSIEKQTQEKVGQIFIGQEVDTFMATSDNIQGYFRKVDFEQNYEIAKS